MVLSDVGVPEATFLSYLKVKSKVCLSSRERGLTVPVKLPSLQASYNWHIHHLNDSRRFTARESMMPHGAAESTNSDLFTYTSDLVKDSGISRSSISTTTVNQPLLEEQAIPPALLVWYE